MLLFSRKIS
jgi:hypothetical protein